MNCGYENSAVTHTNKNAKNKVVLAWRAPIDGAGQTIEFSFSVVKDFGTYWTKKIATNTLTILSSQSGQSAVDIEPEDEPEAESEAESDAESEAEAEYEGATAEGAAAEGEPEEDIPEAYKGCNENRGCFGTKFDDSSENCIESGTCKIMSSYQYDPSTKQYNFQLHLKTPVDSSQYMALALSKDDKMGEDLVISCQTLPGREPQISYNRGRSNVEAETESNLIKTVATNEVDGVSLNFHNEL